MAQSLETIRSSLLTTIFGRRLGLTPDEYVGGTKEIKKAVEDITTTVPTTVLAYGVTRVLTSGSSQGPVQHFLPAPVAGVTKRIILQTTSTGSYQFLSTANGASILSASDGTTKSLINFIGQGGAVLLEGLTSAVWAVVGQPGISSTAVASNMTYTTST